MQSIAIIGAGTQGSMLAFRCLAYEKLVYLYSRRESSRQEAVRNIRKHFAQWQSQERVTAAHANAALRRLHVAASLEEALVRAELVIENIPEYLEQKQQLWREIDALAPPRALLTTNSSSFTSSDIGALLSEERKPRTFNLNFMTPTQDDLVEVMWNDRTSEETKTQALAFLRSLHHVPVVTRREIKGFSLNRVWRAIKKESLRLWAEGYTTPEEFDRAWMLEWGTPYGPFGLMDKVGLDVVRQIELSYHDESGSPSDLPPRALEEMVDRGDLGEKSGKGFYNYPNPAYLSPGFLRGEGQP